MVDLTESNGANGTEQETENLPPVGCQIKKEILSINPTLNKKDFNLQKSVFALQRDCDNPKPKQRCLDSQHQMQTDKEHHHAPTVKLRRLPFLETNLTELKTSRSYVSLSKDCTQMSLLFRQLDGNSEAPESNNNLMTTTTSNCLHMEPSLVESPRKAVESLFTHEQQNNSNEFTGTQLSAKISEHLQSRADSPCSDKGSSVTASKEHSTREDKRDDFCSSMLIPSLTSPSSSQHKAQGSLQREVICANLEQLELDKAHSRQSCPSPPNSPTTGLNPSELFDIYSLSHKSPISHNLMSQVNPIPTCEQTLPENTSEWQSEKLKADEASNSPDFLCCSIPSEPSLSVSKTDMDDGSGTGTYRGDLGIDSPVSILWQEGSDGEQVNGESRFDMDFRAASREDRHFVCPFTLRKIMSGPAQALVRYISPDVYICIFILLSLTHYM